MTTEHPHREAHSDYFARRAREEEGAAAASSCPEAREAHEKIAKLFERRANDADPAREGSGDPSGMMLGSRMVTLGKRG